MVRVRVKGPRELIEVLSLGSSWLSVDWEVDEADVNLPPEVVELADAIQRDPALRAAAAAALAMIGIAIRHAKLCEEILAGGREEKETSAFEN